MLGARDARDDAFDARRRRPPPRLGSQLLGRRALVARQDLRPPLHRRRHSQLPLSQRLRVVGLLRYQMAQVGQKVRPAASRYGSDG